uniref:Uncharacterized protein n=1 Tax=Oryza rufipogon TaxID=4529 RepID=A0A0E0R007_ORYRU
MSSPSSRWGTQCWFLSDSVAFIEGGSSVLGSDNGVCDGDDKLAATQTRCFTASSSTPMNLLVALPSREALVRPRNPSWLPITLFTVAPGEKEVEVEAEAEVEAAPASGVAATEGAGTTGAWIQQPAAGHPHLGREEKEEEKRVADMWDPHNFLFLFC